MSILHCASRVAADAGEEAVGLTLVGVCEVASRVPLACAHAAQWTTKGFGSFEENDGLPSAILPEEHATMTCFAKRED